MKFAFQSPWLRILTELLPAQPRIRRYRVVPADLERQIHRLLRRRIGRQIRSAAADNQG